MSEIEKDFDKWLEENMFPCEPEHAYGARKAWDYQESRIATLESQLRWIPVEERLPEINKWVLAYWRPVDHKERPWHREVIVSQLLGNSKPTWWGNAMEYDQETHVTHWLPIPSIGSEK